MLSLLLLALPALGACDKMPFASGPKTPFDANAAMSYTKAQLAFGPRVPGTLQAQKADPNAKPQPPLAPMVAQHVLVLPVQLLRADSGAWVSQGAASFLLALGHLEQTTRTYLTAAAPAEPEPGAPMPAMHSWSR